MKRFHIAIAVSSIAKSIEDYSSRLGCQPAIIVNNEYALWRTETLNFSIRKVDGIVGVVRHLGWEDPEATTFTAMTDCNGLLWERFDKNGQLEEIRRAWPETKI